MRTTRLLNKLYDFKDLQFLCLRTVQARAGELPFDRAHLPAVDCYR